jgi:aromatic ring hydroxylase
LNVISEITSRAYGGYQAVLAIHAEGSIEAEKMAMLRAYDSRRAVNLALQLAGLDVAVEQPVGD